MKNVLSPSSETRIALKEARKPEPKPRPPFIGVAVVVELVANPIVIAVVVLIVVFQFDDEGAKNGAEVKKSCCVRVEGFLRVATTSKESWERQVGTRINELMLALLLGRAKTGNSISSDNYRALSRRFAPPS